MKNGIVVSVTNANCCTVKFNVVFNFIISIIKSIDYQGCILAN